MHSNRFTTTRISLLCAMIMLAQAVYADGKSCELPAKVAEQFANQYVQWLSSHDAEATTIDWLSAHELASETLLKHYQQLDAAAWQHDPELGPGADLLLDAQDFPDSGFAVASCDAQRSLVMLRGKDWPDFLLAVKLGQYGKEWLVDGIGSLNLAESERAPR